MDMKAKTLLALSLSALLVSGCTTSNGRYTFGQQADAGTGGEGVTHTHNGVAHTHPLPEGGLSHSHNYNTGTAATCRPCGTTTMPVVNNTAATTQEQGNCHVHEGRRHCHPLPASGTNHVHNQGTAAATNTATVAPTTNYDYSTSTATSGSSYYDYGTVTAPVAKGQVTHSHDGKTHAHVLPASGMNHTHNAGSTSISNTYSTYASGGSAVPATASGGGSTYTVQRGDTVFQVMRNTGVYWKDIIKLNNLQAPDYTIVPGQVLRLK